MNIGKEIRIEGMKDDFRNLILESEMFQQGRDQGNPYKVLLEDD